MKQYRENLNENTAKDCKKYWLEKMTTFTTVVILRTKTEKLCFIASLVRHFAHSFIQPVITAMLGPFYRLHIELYRKVIYILRLEDPLGNFRNKKVSLRKKLL